MSAVQTQRKSRHEMYLDVIKSFVLTVDDGRHAVFTDLTWAEYVDVMRFRDEHRSNVRLAFVRGRLEIMATSFQHEKWKKLLARLFEMLVYHFDIAHKAAGNMTIDREDLDQGFEPDECYYLQNLASVATLAVIDFTTNPPPDLAIESEYSRNILERLPLYAAIGICEVWRCDHGNLQILVLEGQSYRPVDRSLAMPFVSSELMNEFLSRANEDNDNRILRDFEARIRTLLPSVTG